MRRTVGVLVGGFFLLSTVAHAQDARAIVSQAVQTELAADAADHSHWLYFDVDRKPSGTVKQWVAETRGGDLDRVVENNGQKLSRAEQQSRMENFIRDHGAQAKQRKDGQHDDQQASQMLSMLPHAFIWTKSLVKGNTTVLHFKPDPNFHPPTWESRVFAAMEGEMTVDNAQHRIVSLKGRMIHDVLFGEGLFGHLKAGGSFDVERRETGKGVWQITETHVHIQGRALLFKDISEDEDEQKTQFRQLTGNPSFDDAERELLAIDSRSG
ncbi:MAG TPA: hypothetical protein VL991_01850 [Terracidiphilus sp.]|jgi:hypothetical protein|nr:hypothetical protein [Terracidiphilus sp.]